MNLKIIKLPVFGILLNILSNKKGGGISSDLHEIHASKEYNTAIDAIESLVLAHACSGIDVTSPAYLEGIETAVEAIVNNV